MSRTIEFTLTLSLCVAFAVLFYAMVRGPLPPDHVADASKMVDPTPIPWRPDDFNYDDARTIRYAFARLGLDPAFDLRANDDGLALIYRDRDGRRMEVLMPPVASESIGVQSTGRVR